MEEAKTEQKTKKIMVAIDESEYSHYALRWAIDNLRDTIVNSQFFILTVQPVGDLTFVYASSFGPAPSELITYMQENQRKFASMLLEKAEAICAEHGFSAERLTEVGDPKQVICEQVEKHDIQMLVLGSHSRGAIGRAFLGSVSNYCVHHAKCPVLVVKKPT